MTEKIRTNGASLGGNGFDVRGPMLQAGDTAPDFQAIATNMSAKTLADYAGKIKLISVVPSLDTSVCSAQTVRFNQEAASLSDDIVILTISADLPFAQKRWCGAEGVEAVETLSTHKDMQFSDAYGVHIVDMRMNQRAVFVLDRDDKVIYSEYVTEIGHEVNFAAALEAARTAV